MTAPWATSPPRAHRPHPPPQLAAPEAFAPGLAAEDRNLGDIVISAPAVSRHCAAHGVDPLHHYDVLFAHGVAHLLGYDHEDERDAVAMAAVEARILAALAGGAGDGALR